MGPGGDSPLSISTEWKPCYCWRLNSSFNNSKCHCLTLSKNGVRMHQMKEIIRWLDCYEEGGILE